MAICRQQVIANIVNDLTNQSAKKMMIAQVIRQNSMSRTTFYRLFPEGLNGIYREIMTSKLAPFHHYPNWAEALDALLSYTEQHKILFSNLCHLMNPVQFQEGLREFSQVFVQGYFGQRYFYKVAKGDLLFFTDAFYWQIWTWFSSKFTLNAEDIRQKLNAFHFLDGTPITVKVP